MSQHEQTLTEANISLLLQLNHAKRQNEAAKLMANAITANNIEQARAALAGWLELQ